MRILITGATGFLGWNAVRHFSGRGYGIVAGFHTLPHYLHNVDDCQPVALDIADRTTTQEVVHRYQPDIILHAAALARPQTDTDVDHVHTVNVQGTRHLVDVAAEQDIPLVYISTDLLFSPDAGICNEETPVSPTSANNYALTKLQAEQIVRGASCRWVIIRSALLFGTSGPRSGGFNGFIERRWMMNEPAPLFTDQFRSFLYVNDLCRAIEQVALSNSTWGELYVCGGDERLSRAEFGLRYADARGVDRSMCHLMLSTELEGYVGGPSDITLDCTKLKSTGWDATPIADALQEMVRERALP